MQRPNRVLPRALFCNSVRVGRRIRVVVMVLLTFIKVMMEPAMLNLGQLMKVMTTPMNPKVLLM